VDKGSLVTGLIFDIKRFSVHDGPGIRTTVFFKGCPLRCAWCHNPESQDPKPERVYWEQRCIRCLACIAACNQGAIQSNGNQIITDAEKCTLCGECVELCYTEARQILGHEMTAVQLWSEIERDVAFYDQSNGGVTFSGGEPLMQPEFLLALLRGCQERGVHTALDTCGFARWETLDRIRAYVDLFLFDLKLLDEGRHKKLTGVSNARILENLRRLVRAEHNIVLRVPVIPGVNDDVENIRAIGSFASALQSLDRIDVLPYHSSATSKYERLDRKYSLSGLYPPSEERIAEITHILEGFGLQVKVGG
jgi:pyruvate formate lyase activating enzyme